MSRHLWNWELFSTSRVSLYRDLIGLLEQAEMHLRKADELLDNLERGNTDG